MTRTRNLFTQSSSQLAETSSGVSSSSKHRRPLRDNDYVVVAVERRRPDGMWELAPNQKATCPFCRGTSIEPASLRCKHCDGEFADHLDEHCLFAPKQMLILPEPCESAQCSNGKVIHWLRLSPMEKWTAWTTELFNVDQAPFDLSVMVSRSQPPWEGCCVFTLEQFMRNIPPGTGSAYHVLLTLMQSFPASTHDVRGILFYG